MTQPEIVAADPYEGNTEPDPNVDADVYPVLGAGQIRDAFGNVRKATSDEVGNVGFTTSVTSNDQVETTQVAAPAKATPTK